MKRRLFGAAALLAVLSGGLAVGFGAGGSAVAGTRTTGVAVTSASTRTATGSALTQPAVTVVSTTTTTPASELPGHHRPAIVVGDMNTPEQFVLGALYSIALSQAGYTVTITRNIGPYTSAQQALKDGSVELYPDYLDSDLLPSWDRTVAGLRQRFASVAAAYSAGEHYASRRGFRLLTPTPGSDTLGLAVTSQFSAENLVTSMTQLAKLPLLTYGMPFGFGGLWRAEKAYRFKAGTVQFGATGDQYDELDRGSVQVAYADSTDPQLGTPDYVLLRDPKHVYGFGNIVPVTTARAVRTEGPAFVRIVDRVDALLSTRTLRGLNAEVQLLGHDQVAVAAQFLQGNGLLPATRYQVVAAH